MNIECPNCKKEMTLKKVDLSKMSPEERQSYEMDMEVPFECNTCNISRNYCLYPFDWASNEPFWVPRAEINTITINKLIERAIEKRCYIEACSLIHNVIESHLRQEIFKQIFDKYSDIPYDCLDYPEDMEDQLKKYPEIEEKTNILNNSNKYLNDITNLSYSFGIIDKETYTNIKKFNNDRNNQIHGLLKKTKTIYPDIIPIIELGRKLQLKIIENKTPELIEKEILKIKPTSKELEEDKFLDHN